MKSEFRNNFPFEKRKEEAMRIKAKYPDKIPCVLEYSSSCSLPKNDKKKFLVPDNLTIGQFVYVIRKRIKLSPDKAIFLFVNGILVSSSTSIMEAYSNYKNEDGFLYLVVSDENTFGSFTTTF